MRAFASTLLLLCLAGIGDVLASDVFIGTLRAPAGSREDGGHLYRVDVEGGATKFIGRILVDGTQPVGIAAMAFHPRTNVLYGITVGVNDAKRASLLTIDPMNAEARVVARLSKPLSDISFAPDGRLFGWTLNTGQLALVDLVSGSVTALGDAGAAPVGGAFAIDAGGNGFVVPWSVRGRLDRVDLRVGTTSPGPQVSGLDLTSLRSMAFSPAGELFATHSIRNASSASTLLRIDTATGETSAIRDIPEDSEAIAVAATHSVANAQALRYLAYAIFAVVFVMLAWMHLHGRGRRKES